MLNIGPEYSHKEMKSSTAAVLSQANSATPDTARESAGLVSSQTSVSRTAKRCRQRAHAHIVAATLEALEARPAIRTRKVLGIRERLRSGEYAPTAAAIARRLIGS